MTIYLIGVIGVTIWLIYGITRTAATQDEIPLRTRTEDRPANGQRGQLHGRWLRVMDRRNGTALERLHDGRHQ